MGPRPTLYLIRHGETEFNAAGLMAGQRDSNLTERGRDQAAANGRVLRSLIGGTPTMDFIASPLGRTQTTMALVAEAFDPPPRHRNDARLMEAHFGEWQGRNLQEGQDFRRADRKRLGQTEWEWVWPGGESRAQLYARVRALYEELTADTVIVGHAGSVRVLRGLALGLPREEMMSFYPENAGIIVIQDSRESRHGS